MAGSGVFKSVAIKRETTYGTVPAAGSAWYLRRAKSTIDLAKQTYKSNEIRTDMQVADYRHGVRSVAGQLSGEISPGAYSDMLSSVLRRDFTTPFTAITAASLTIATSGSYYTVTRGAGSWLTDGVKQGMVVRLSVGALNAANIAKNLYVLAVTSATVLTVVPLNGSAMVAEGPISGCTISAPGKYTYMPTTGHTSISYAVEHWHSDTSMSEVFSGIRFTKAGIALPPTGIATVQFDALGKDITRASSQYYTSPTALTTKAVVAAVNGIVAVGGTTVAVITGLNFTLSNPQANPPVVGSNSIPAQFPGVLEVDGQATMQLVDGTYRDMFIDETETTLQSAFTCDNTAAADFIAFMMSRVKFGGASKDDGQQNITQTLPFKALLQTAGGAGTAYDSTTFAVQDSAAP